MVLRRIKGLFGAVNTAILRAGAIAVAITAVIVLVHQAASSSHRLPPGARFDKVKINDEVPLEEYEVDFGGRSDAAFFRSRLDRTPLAGYRLVADDVLAPPTGSAAAIHKGADASAVGASSPRSGTSTSTTSTSATPTSTTTTAPAGPGTTDTIGPAPPSGPEVSKLVLAGHADPASSQRVKGAVVQLGSGAPPDEVSEVLADTASISRSATAPAQLVPVPQGAGVPSARAVEATRCAHCQMLPVIDRALAENHHDPAAAARELHTAEKEWRKRSHGGKPELVGVEIHFNLDLRGFTGKVEKVQYIIRSRRHRLPKEWWGKHPLVVVLTKADENETVIPEGFWALIPQTPGDYYLRLELVNSEGEELTSEYTEDFR